MTLAFALAGTCEVVTGLALRPTGAPGRLMLIAGGLAGVLVAVNLEHAGGSLAHACWAGVGFAAMVAWPGGAWRRGPSVPWGLRPAVSAVAPVIMLGLLAWFLAELIGEGGQVGLAERVMGVAQAGWPLVVVLSCRLRRPGARTPSAGPPAAALGAEPTADRACHAGAPLPARSARPSHRQRGDARVAPDPIGPGLALTTFRYRAAAGLRGRRAVPMPDGTRGCCW